MRTALRVPGQNMRASFGGTMGIFDRNADFEQTPILESALGGETIKAISSGLLPTIQTGDIELPSDEICRYVEPAIYEKKIRVPRGAKKSPKRRLFRSRFQETPEEAAANSVVDIAFEQVRGFLYVTDRRVIFSAPRDSWSRETRELLAVKPYLNCVKLQFGKDGYKVFVPDGNICHAVLRLVQGGRA